MTEEASLHQGECLRCGVEVYVDTDGAGELVELDPRTWKVHVCPPRQDAAAPAPERGPRGRERPGASGRATGAARRERVLR